MKRIERDRVEQIGLDRLLIGIATVHRPTRAISAVLVRPAEPLSQCGARVSTANLSTINESNKGLILLSLGMYSCLSNIQ